MWFIYVIQHNLSKCIYIGRTNDFRQRLLKHNRGQSKATKRKDGEWIPVYLEIYKSKKDADMRECKLKHHGSAKHELMKRISNSLL